MHKYRALTDAEDWLPVIQTNNNDKASSIVHVDISWRQFTSGFFFNIESTWKHRFMCVFTNDKRCRWFTPSARLSFRYDKCSVGLNRTDLRRCLNCRRTWNLKCIKTIIRLIFLLLFSWALLRCHCVRDQITEKNREKMRRNRFVECWFQYRRRAQWLNASTEERWENYLSKCKRTQEREESKIEEWKQNEIVIYVSLSVMHRHTHIITSSVSFFRSMNFSS